MRRPLFNSALFILLTLTVVLAAADGAPPIPCWVDPLGREPLPHAAWLSANPERSEVESPLTSRSWATPERAAGDLLIIVEDRLSAALDSELTTWYADLAAEGWTIDERLYTGGDVGVVRQVIAGSGADGAVLVGQIPVPWFEMDEPDWGYSTHEEFPCDLFFMDTDGVWADNDGDGILDSHTGAIDPELWVSRISAREQTFGLEIDLLRSYFNKNHQYRTAGLGVPDRGLAYNDDDWAYSGYDYDLGDAYADVTAFNSDGTTTADHLLGQYTQGYEFVHLMSHSSPWGHTFKVPGGYAGSIYNYEIEALAPEAVFVNLFSCSCTRFVEFDNIGNWYIFHDGPGLVSLGSAKTGSMLNHDEFYTPLGSGLCIGEAYEDWAQSNIYPGMSNYNKNWFYGLNILGDATLLPHGDSREPSRDGFRNPLPPSDDFEDWITVSTSVHSDVAPALVGTQGGAWCAWVSAEQGRSSIYVSELGGDWSAPQALDNATYWEYGPALEVHDGETHCVFSRFDGDTYDYDLLHSVNSGGGWTTPQVIRQLEGYDLYPALCYSGGKLWLVWQKWTGDGCYLMSSANQGSWTNLSAVGSDEAAEPSLCPDGGGGVHLAYQGRGADTACEIRLRHNGGSGWSAAETLPGTGSNPAHPVLLRSSDGVLWCAFEDVYADTTAVYVSRDTGGGWQTPERLTDGGLAAHRPGLAEGVDGVVCVFWADDGAERSAYLCDYDGGWEAPERLSDNGLTAWEPAVCAAADGRLTTAWQQYDGDDLQIAAAAEPSSGITAVELAAASTDEGVLLSWSIDGEEPSSIRVLRGEDDPVALSGALPGETTRWLDRDVETGGGYHYWLEVTATDGGVERFGPTEAVVVPEARSVPILEVPWPNPAVDSITLAFELPSGVDDASITIYDLSGRVIEEICFASAPGRQTISLDTTAYQPGVYLARLATDAAGETRRFVIGR